MRLPVRRGGTDRHPDADVSTRITQTGNNNHVGGPGGTTGGILQYGSGDRGILTVRQTGTGNTTDIEQVAPDTGIRVTQNGTHNSATVVDRGTSMFIGPVIEQNGDGNTVSATALDTGLSHHTIAQTGRRNHAITNQIGGAFLELSIQQLGVDNQAEIDQAGSDGSATINQNGNNNLASINQSGATSFQNTALITQIGNSNNASIRQAGVGFASTVNQIGSRNYASVYQH